MASCDDGLLLFWGGFWAVAALAVFVPFAIGRAHGKRRSAWAGAVAGVLCPALAAYVAPGWALPWLIVSFVCVVAAGTLAAVGRGTHAQRAFLVAAFLPSLTIVGVTARTWQLALQGPAAAFC